MACSQRMVLIGILLLLRSFASSESLPYSYNDDLTSFITRPELKAPKFIVNASQSDQISPGFWFVTPYKNSTPDYQTSRWEPCQVGPHIFDNSGELVWSGACMFENRNAFDFKTVDIGGETHLSLVLGYREKPYMKGKGVILNQNYEITNELSTSDDFDDFNFHEFTVSGQELSALHLRESMIFHNYTDDAGIRKELWSVHGGFREIDIQSGDTIFRWDSVGKVKHDESSKHWERRNKTTLVWDFMHINAVDKNKEGDYLVSVRHTDTIYKVSGKDGSIIWRLGGRYSDFISDFRFSRQHHTRWLSTNETHATISFLDNASDLEFQIANVSSGFIVSLHTAASPMTATLIERYDRPDESLTRLRGSVQILPNDNVLVSWSKQGYMSEFTRRGRSIMDASFASKRFNTYRAFKSNFTGFPSEQPVLKAFTYGVGASSAVTIAFVSWNGATEVRSWNFYDGSTQASIEAPVGNIKKDGFETLFTFNGLLENVWAEALDADGRSLGKTSVENTAIPATFGHYMEHQNVHQEGTQMVGSEFRWVTSNTYVSPAPLIFLMSGGVLLYITFKHRHMFRWLLR
ncbi:hypothetical protein N7532_011057 [Penicillium argentinense]|uniref:ASST-domain-containing protein n=1 Tax=Penicillium argentinense TaxID=1131581 RepID=A0A9W9EHS4_9EURO|nr:uncharacterized protein N7532_011057 [Penicillium argentinense]KAJ5082014.1 hypothetical protein N7532_011057 [Penicillium argentinense]